MELSSKKAYSMNYKKLWLYKILGGYSDLTIFGIIFITP